MTQDATGFTSTGSPGNGGTGLSARGFTGHNSVMQLYDGTRLYVGSGTVTFPINTWSAERIEVLRGPASVLYGEGAIGGVINLVPKKPTDYFTGEGEVAIGTDGMRRFGAGAGGPVNDQFSYRLDVSGMQSNGWMDAHAEFNSLALSGAISYRPLKELKFTLSHDYADQNPLSYWGTPLINGRIPDEIRFKSFNVNGNDTNFVDNWTQFKTEWSPNEWFSLSNVAYRLGSDRHWRNVETYDYQEGGAHAGLVERTTYGDLFTTRNSSETAWMPLFVPNSAGKRRTSSSSGSTSTRSSSVIPITTTPTGRERRRTLLRTSIPSTPHLVRSSWCGPSLPPGRAAHPSTRFLPRIV